MSTIRLTVRDIPEYEHARLKEIAEKNRRTLNAQIVHVIERFVEIVDRDSVAKPARKGRRKK